ncbi:Uncharacterized protein C11orf74-like protein [Trichoplax sp. H2]|nr:Uncharacterized protein C11orf74-like protein [Trichoplax sp. H2]|eukprot:RDD36846.1 Uncharacterized protein C11orf74-like protein [Trichoplax sp. H2]
MTEKNDPKTPDANPSELIDKVFDMPLQSYDDFMSEFMYLTKDNVKQTKLSTSNNYNKNYESQDTQPKTVNAEVELSEEQIGIGLRRQEFLMRNDSESLPSAIKFDNLVPLEDDLGIEDLDNEDKTTICKTTKTITKLMADEQNDDFREDEKSTIESELDNPIKYPSQQSPLPGEISNDNQENFAVNSTTTYLKLQTTNENISLESTGDDVTISMEEKKNEKTRTNDVIPFSLDTSFDYDRVQLTPKFSQNDLLDKKQV